MAGLGLAALLAAAIRSGWWPGRGIRGDVPASAVLRVPWPGWQRQLEITDPAVLRQLARALPDRPVPRPPPVPPPARPPAADEEGDAFASFGGPLPRWQLILRYPQGSAREFVALPDGTLRDAASGAPAGGAALRQATQALGLELSEHLFGEPLPWPEVDRMFPFDAEATIEDLRTGLWLRVRRYGGYRHADVEPVTRQDTAVLHRIFGGQWTWRRRPVVAIIQDRRIAASVNGMPHGNGLIAANDFPGHFCLHFLGSQVHASGRIDPSHQLMVHQASGRLIERLAEAPPAQLVQWALAAVQESDEAALHLTVTGWDATLARRLLENIRHVTIVGLVVSGATVRAELVVYYEQPNPDAGYRQVLQLPLQPAGWRGGWTVRLADLAPLLKVPTSTPLLLRSGGYPEC
ncbi:hypothetical protein U7230_07295 [Carboxydochorda subterranea]|uniref:Uncharacterized protein n=1 Tax=Carboxydichorda subterranea TaxID=3109565 RepID=A0ABZ1C1A6_9FIRM|nr:hypothetical protein [Limnochorda sp. L945t]WRP18788.1 hypothetical protein U7230_07295 [Limnochorda sp. L945t]